MSSLDEITDLLKSWHDKEVIHSKCSDIEFEQRLGFFMTKRLRAFWLLWAGGFMSLVVLGIIAVGQFYEVKAVLLDYRENIKPTMEALHKEVTSHEKRLIILEQNPNIKYPGTFKGELYGKAPK